MTSPMLDSDLLMLCASFSRAPSAPDLLTRSEPAKSTKFSFPGEQIGEMGQGCGMWWIGTHILSAFAGYILMSEPKE